MSKTEVIVMFLKSFLILIVANLIAVFMANNSQSVTTAAQLGWMFGLFGFVLVDVFILQPKREKAVKEMTRRIKMLQEYN